MVFEEASGCASVGKLHFIYSSVGKSCNGAHSPKVGPISRDREVRPSPYRTQ